jgi:hypothetical protein
MTNSELQKGICSAY